ncbi:MAG: YqaJ viral recombinase family protein [Nitrososphaera sp.]|nr:YqaJ viral recombinase family protein [Nitrososphaera sp.]
MSTEKDDQELELWQEWIASRCGFITASHIGDILAKPTTKRYQTYAQRLATERTTGMVFVENINHNRYMDAGQNLEINAFGFYQIGNDVELHYHGSQDPIFIKCEDVEWFGCSPDLLEGDAGIGEIKIAFNPRLHRKRVERGFEGSKKGGGHFHQAHGQLLATDRQYVNLISHCPGLKYPDNLFVQTVERNEEEIDKLRQAIQTFNAEIERLRRGG